jgi:ribosomal protein S18 acetylase RimI-like enzyme
VVVEIPELTTLRHDETATRSPAVSLRPVAGSDEELLLRIFAESHCAGFELLGLAPPALDGLVRMQFQARQSQYRAYPGATEYLIWLDTEAERIPAGSCSLSDNPGQLRVLDIAVLAMHRRQGIARSVLLELCALASAAGKPVGLSVWHDNAAARRLYRAVGFMPDQAVGEEGDLGNGYFELRYFYDDTQDAPAQHRAGAR